MDPPFIGRKSAGQRGGGYGVGQRGEVNMAPMELVVGWELNDFLREVLAAGLISAATEQAAWRAWAELLRASGARLPVPAACTGPDGRLLLSWDAGRHHLELEFAADEPPSLFYRDRESAETWLQDWIPGTPVPPVVIEVMERFTVAAAATAWASGEK